MKRVEMSLISSTVLRLKLLPRYRRSAEGQYRERECHEADSKVEVPCVCFTGCPATPKHRAKQIFHL